MYVCMYVGRYVSREQRGL